MAEEPCPENLDALFGAQDVIELVRQRFEIEDGDIVDARGLRCPQPARRLRKALSACENGCSFALVTDDPLARIDIPQAALQSGATVVAQCSMGTHAAFLIETRK